MAHESPHQHYLRGLQLEVADLKAARAAYESCLAGDCSHLEARINLGRLLHLEGLHDEAANVYQQTQDLDATLYFNLGVLNEDMGRDSEAIRYYREAIIHDPGLMDAHYNLSMILEKHGEAQAAYRHLLAYHRLTDAHQNPADIDEPPTED